MSPPKDSFCIVKAEKFEDLGIQKSDFNFKMRIMNVMKTVLFKRVTKKIYNVICRIHITFHDAFISVE